MMNPDGNTKVKIQFITQSCRCRNTHSHNGSFYFLFEIILGRFYLREGAKMKGMKPFIIEIATGIIIIPKQDFSWYNKGNDEHYLRSFLYNSNIGNSKKGG